MADPTAVQIARIRRFIGDTATEQAFSDAEITTIWGDNSDDLENTVVELFEALLADNAKLTTYRQGQSFEDLNKLFDHLKHMLSYWRGKAGLGQGAIQTGELKADYYEDDGTFAEETDSLGYGLDWYV